jgi:transposase InsO family protein
LNKVASTYKDDVYFKDVLEGVKLACPPQQYARFRSEGAHLFYKDPFHNTARLCVPNNKDLRLTLLHDHHDAITAGHLGATKTINAISQLYYWPKMGKDIKDYVRSCSSCQRNKTSQETRSQLMKPLDIPLYRWHTVTMDFAGPFPRAGEGGWDAVIIVVDKATKRSHFIPSKTTDTAIDTAKRFFNEVVRLHGLPAVIVSDRDAKFTSFFWQGLFQAFGTKLAMSTAYHPQTDGQSERMVRTMKEMLRHFINHKQDDWPGHLAGLEFAYNNSVHPSTHATPFELDLGQHPATPHSVARAGGRQVQAADDFIAEQEAALMMAQNAMQCAQEAQARQYNLGRQERPYKVGDLALVSTKHLQPDFLYAKGSKKLRPKYIGPFTIIGPQVDPGKVINAYELDLPQNLRIHPTVNVEYLKRYHVSPDNFSGRPDSGPPPLPDIVNDIPEFEVEKIIDHKTSRRDDILYLVKWRGYAAHDNTWEPTEHLGNAAEAIKAYWASAKHL